MGTSIRASLWRVRDVLVYYKSSGAGSDTINQFGIHDENIRGIIALVSNAMYLVV